MLAAEATFFNTTTRKINHNFTELYTFATVMWEEVPNNPELVNNFKMINAGNNIFYIFGGYIYATFFEKSNIIAGFNSQTRRWFIVTGLII